VTATERLKGAVAEREVVLIFKANGWPNVERTSNGRIQTGRGDIANGPVGCHFEIKRHERLNVPKAFDQVKRDADPLDIPVLIHRPSRHEYMATLPLDELLALLQLRDAG
jgi:hypothetical protein